MQLVLCGIVINYGSKYETIHLYVINSRIFSFYLY